MTDKSASARELATELLEDIELSRTTVTQQVLKATRLARLMDNQIALAWLHFETSGIPNTPEGRRHMSHTARWTNEEEGKGMWGSVANIEATIDALKLTLDASRIESLSGESLYPVTRDTRNYQIDIGVQIVSNTKVVNQVSSILHNFTLETYYELEFSARQQTLFETTRTEIDGLLAPEVGQSLEKIDSIYQRLSEGDPEAISQAMSTCRRLIDSFADAVYPAVSGGAITIDGVAKGIDSNNTRNRIEAFVAVHIESKSRRKRLRQQLTNIYERASAGTHDEVTPEEARYLFLSTYVLLGEILVSSQDQEG